MTVALPWSSVSLATSYGGNPRVSTAWATAFYCTWRFHGKCHGCGHGTCRGSVRGNLRSTNHGNPRKYHGNCHGILHGNLHVNCRGNPRQSTANPAAFHGKCHGNPPTASTRAIATELHGCCHGNFHRRQTTAISTPFRGIPRPSAAIATAILQETAIATAISTDVNPLQFPRKPPAFRGHPRQLPRQSSNTRQLPRQFHGRQTTVISTAFRGHPRQLHCRTPRQSVVVATANSTSIKRNFNRKLPR